MKIKIKKLLLDTGILGQLCHPRKTHNKPIVDWVTKIVAQASAIQLCVPEIADYELRRKFIHLIKKKQADELSLTRLNQLVKTVSIKHKNHQIKANQKIKA